MQQFDLPETEEEAVRLLRGAHILLVEDNMINQELARELMECEGMTVCVAQNGAEALQFLDHEVFDGVIMDCQMPVMDGFDATLKIRQQPRFEDLPVVALTANVTRADKARVLEVGMNDLITKPIDVALMFRTMASWIRPGRSQD